MQNTDTVLYNINTAQSRAGTQSQAIIAQPNEVRHYSVKGQRKANVVLFKSLIRANLGKIATITDEESRVYRGLIFSESIEIVVVDEPCVYDFEFDIMLYGAIDYLLLEDSQILLFEDSQEALLETSL